ncbi:MAG: Phospho-N-acetylmuramoyl-pentapeptide-transferase, partial [uncultured Blastococcus sp.]
EVGPDRVRVQPDHLDPSHAAGHPRLPPPGPRAGDPGRRSREPPVQEGHAHHGRHGHRRRDRRRLHDGPPLPQRPGRLGVHRHRPDAALPHGRHGHRRVPRRLPQDPPPAQPRAEQDRQAGRPAGGGCRVRGAGDQLPGRPGCDTGVHRRLLRPRHRPVRPGLGRLRHPRVPVHRRVLQRGQPHRRAGRPGGGRVGDGVRLLRLHLLLAVHPRLRQRAHRGLLHRPRPAGRDARGRGGAGRLPGVPVVEHQPGADLHGRHRLAGPRRADVGSGDRHPHRAAARRPRGPLRGGDPVGRHPGGVLPGDPPPGLPDGPPAPPLRARGLDGEHRHRAVLAGDGDGRGVRYRPVLRRLAELRRTV